ncbi:Bactoprenol-linked glucose translocase-like protein [Wohlfahrtiimonas chitiniclastica SH04]|uniref:Bactoprenol-linked glucose translocase n=1 Tax=Wohlfahrtiimonas chitiniclastica SH04 TaxID=1261130 RepID=L8XUH5_9GAMM|nr:Bactoprenol-linked glucose translocase-like protein [Wohlfahrtiimonas chitiniclastica SH04]
MFIRYVLVGFLNTAIHWMIFGICFWIFFLNQSSSNFIAFIFAVTFSFFMNAKFTFKKQPTSNRYILFTIFMGFLSFLIGKISDQFMFNPMITLVVFSALSLILGFIYSRFLVFR